jgi:hypothetical protein
MPSYLKEDLVVIEPHAAHSHCFGRKIGQWPANQKVLALGLSDPQIRIHQRFAIQRHQTALVSLDSRGDLLKELERLRFAHLAHDRHAIHGKLRLRG